MRAARGLCRRGGRQDCCRQVDEEVTRPPGVVLPSAFLGNQAASELGRELAVCLDGKPKEVWCTQSASGDLPQLGPHQHQWCAGWARCRVPTSAPSPRQRPKRLRFRRPSELPRRAAPSQLGLHRSRSQVGGPYSAAISHQQQSQRRLHSAKPQPSVGVMAAPAHAQRSQDVQEAQPPAQTGGPLKARQEHCSAAGTWCVLFAESPR